MKKLIPFLYISLTGCLDPKINVDVNIERVEDTASSTDVDNNSQPSSDPNDDDGGGDDPNDGGGDDSNDPNDGGGGDPNDPNDGGGGDPNDPNDGGGGDPNDPNDGGGGDPNDPNDDGGGDPNDPNDGGGGDPNDPNDGGGGDPDDQVPNDPNGGDGSGESFTADICEWWLSCATGENNPGVWGQDYSSVDQGCFSNHNNVSDADQLTWFECVESSMGSGTATGADAECTDVLNCGNPW